MRGWSLIFPWWIRMLYLAVLVVCLDEFESMLHRQSDSRQFHLSVWSRDDSVLSDNSLSEITLVLIWIITLFYSYLLIHTTFTRMVYSGHKMDKWEGMKNEPPNMFHTVIKNEECFEEWCKYLIVVQNKQSNLLSWKRFHADTQPWLQLVQQRQPVEGVLQGWRMERGRWRRDWLEWKRPLLNWREERLWKRWENWNSHYYDCATDGPVTRALS